jgi:hypothetical protein
MNVDKTIVSKAVGALFILGLASGAALAEGFERATLVVTSTNNATANNIVVFRVDATSAPSLSYVTSLPTGGAGGAGGNAGLVQFNGEVGAVANSGSNSITQLVREGDFIEIGRSFNMARGCSNPVSVAIKHDHLYAVGANCVESHDWPSGAIDGSVVALPDTSAAQVVAGRTWAGVTMKSGSVVQLALRRDGALAGTSANVALPAGANDTPLGAAFWDDVMGFDPAHSPKSLALVDSTPAFPNGNAPCWLAKGPGNIWYSGNTPAKAISIFLSDAQGGAFYKSIALPGAPTDVTVSHDGKWLGVIYTAADGAHIGLFSIDVYGDLKMVATSAAIGVAGFNGIAFSQ